MQVLAKKAAKEVSYLAAKWAVKYGSKIYGAALTYKFAAELAVIPNKIGKIVLKGAPSMLIGGFISFADTFAMFPQMFAESQQCLDKWTKVLKNTHLERDREIHGRALANELHSISRKWENKMGVSAWLNILQMFIPIPFSAWVN